MKHRQEETPTHLSCAVGFISHKSALRGEAKKVQEAQLCKKAGAGSSPASRTQSTRIMGSHSTIVKRAMALIAEDVLAQQESGTNQTVWKTHLRQRQEQAWILSAKTACAFCEEETSAIGKSDCSLAHSTVTHQGQRSVPRVFLSNFVTVLARHWDHIRDQVRSLGVQMTYGKLKLWRPIEEGLHRSLKCHVGQMSIPTEQGVSAALTQCISSSHNAEPFFQR